MVDAAVDKEFKDFCDELRKSSPDIDKIKAGIEKYGMGQLSDSQKALFQSAIFPAPLAKGSKGYKALGFQDMNGIKNTLKAMKEMGFDKTQILNVLTEPRIIMKKDKDGKVFAKKDKSMLAVIATNTYAFDFKRKALQKKDPKSPLLAELLKNEDSLREIQGILGEFDSEMLHEAFNTKDSFTGRSVKYSTLAKKSEMMKPLLNRIENDAAKRQAQTQGRSPYEETVRFGGLNENEEDVLTFSAEPETLNISTGDAPQQNPNTEDFEEKPAQLEDQNNDRKNGKRNFNFDQVKEQDLIQYLYNVWFLGLVNYSMQKGFNLADNAIDYFCGEGGQEPGYTPVATRGLPAPNPTNLLENNSAENPRLPSQAMNRADSLPNPFHQQINDLARDITKDYSQQFKKLINDPTTMQSMTQNIINNIGKEPDKWSPLFIASEKSSPIMIFNPKTARDFITQLNKMYQKDPALFDKQLKTLLKNPEMVLPAFMPKNIRLCSKLAVIDYAVKHLGKDLNVSDKTKKSIKNNAMVKMFDTQETFARIVELKEKEYREKHNIAPDTALSEKQRAKVGKQVDKEFAQYLKDVITTATEVQKTLDVYHLETDAAKRKPLEQKVNKAYDELNKVYNKYISPENEPQSTTSREQPDTQKKEEKMDIKDAAEDERKGQKKETQWAAHSKSQQDQIEAGKERVTQRRVKLKKFKDRIAGKHFVRQSRSQGKTY